MIKENFMLIADGYKYFHDKMYPDFIEYITSTTYVRNPKMDLSFTNGYVCVFGVNLVLQRLENMLRDMVENFSYDNIKDYEYMPEEMKFNFTKLHLFLREIKDKEFLLKEILDIRYVQDGSFLKPGERVMVITNKQEEFRWLPNYLETFINSEIWKGTYIATQAASYMGAIFKAHMDSHNGAYKNSLFTGNIIKFFADSFKNKSFSGVIHDFSSRGMSGIYDVIFHNVAHLLFFNGTDSIAIDHLRINGYYNDLKLDYMVAASEHSVMCSYGYEREVKSVNYLMSKFHNQPLALVLDSYDIFELLNCLSKDDEFKNLLSERNPNCPLVIRGDSGDPVKIMTGNSEIEGEEKRDELERLGLVKSLQKLFPSEFESQIVKAIYGDAITPQRTYEIFLNLYNSKIAKAEYHIVLGAGSFTYNYATRDSVGLVTKATSYSYKDDRGEIVSTEIVKNPVTDKKKSSLNIVENGLCFLDSAYLSDLKHFKVASSLAKEELIEKVFEC